MYRKIKIAYAYKGLTSLPLLLANTEEPFTSMFELKYADGDDEALEMLLDPDQNSRCDIAICDVFAKADLLGLIKKRLGSKEAIKLSGCLINKSPIWIHRTDNSIAPHGISSTDELKLFRITTIKGYPMPNPGWIFCKELQRKLDSPLSNITIIPVDLNPDIEAPIGPGEISLTSNLLKIAIADFKRAEGSSVIYSYASGTDESEKLKDLFYTGILVRTTDDRRQKAAYGMLHSELERWINALYQGNINTLVEEKFSFFKQHVAKYPPVSGLSDSELKDVFKNIVRLIRKEEIYPHDLKGSSKSFNNMFRARKQFYSGLKKIDYSVFYDTHILNHTHSTSWIGKFLSSGISKVRHRFIRPALENSFGSTKYLLFNISQILPLIAIYYLRTHFHESGMQKMIRISLCISIPLTILISTLAPLRHKERSYRPEREKTIASDLLEAAFTANIAIIYALFFALLIEIVKQ